MFVFDGTNQFPLTHTMQGGQHVKVVLTNKNIFGVVLELQNTTVKEQHRSIFGVTYDQYVEESTSFVLFPGQTQEFNFYRFDYQPMHWEFQISTGSDAAIVNINFYSSWIPGMKNENPY